jgi:hypothetical protein
VTIENGRDTPLVEWQTTAGRVSSGRRGFVAPHGQSVVVFPLDDVAGATPRIVVAAFADGSYEGTGPEFDKWLTARRERADDLDYWVKALRSMPRISMVDLRKYLGDRLAERSVHDRPNVENVSDRVRNVLRQYPDGAEVWPPLDRLRAELETAFIDASRQGRAPGGGSEVSGVAIVASRETTTKTYAVAIENLRDVPIEAVGFDELEADGRSRGSRGSDFCVVDPADRTSAHSRIQPHERREFPVFPQADRPLPRYTLSFVLFDDLSFEGSTAARDDILRSREAQADEYAFAIAALKGVAGLPPEQIEAFLQERKIERARQLQEQGRRPWMGGLLDEALRQVRESPQQVLTRVSVYRAHLEQALDRLRRHLPR